MRAHSTGKRIRLTNRDRLWLNAIHQHGPLASSFLLEYAKTMGASEKRSTERLTDLFHEADTAHGGPYLTRPPQQFHTIDSRYNQLVYDLGPAAEKAGYKRQTANGPWLHRFMVSSITASIELAIRDRPDLRIIPQAAILDRADTGLGCEVQIDDGAGKLKKTRLVPDAIFGIEYLTEQGSRFRFFVVEADRATEPLKSSLLGRKSALKSFRQYQRYVGRGVYREHLKLTAPVLVLNVSSDSERTQKMIDLLGHELPRGCSFQLFQTWDVFAPPFRPPEPNSSLLNKAWERLQMPPISINA
ncbi:MAG: replication-relaxation family protein [Pseudomonadota bacterium]